MTWSNYNPEDRIYKVTHHVVHLRGRGEKPFLMASPSKTEDCGDFFISHLREKSIEAIESQRKNRRDDCDLIFHNDGKLWTYR